MKIAVDTKYSIFDEVKYKKLDIFAILEDGEPREEIKQSKIVAVDIQISQLGEAYVHYLMDNEDRICGDFIIEVL